MSSKFANILGQIETSVGRSCEICGRATDSLDYYICSNCRNILYKIILDTDTDDNVATEP